MRRNRKIVFGLTVLLAGFLGFVSIRFFLKQAEEPGGTVLLHYEFPVKAEWEPLPSLPAQPPVLVEPGEPVAATWPAVVATGSPADWSTQSQTPEPNLLSVKKFSLFTMPIGVVDVDRLFSVHPPASETPEERAELIDEIERAVATCAAAHNCVIVLNRSGKSMNGVPVALYSDEQLDLTDEVIHRLGR